MENKIYRTTVRTDSDCDDIPSLAVFSIEEDTAREIVALSKLVNEHGLYKVEKFDYRTTFYRHDPDQEPDQEPDDAEEADDDNVEITDCGTLCVSETQFWFSAYIKHTDIEVLTESQPIADLVTHFSIGANTSAIDEVPVGVSGKLITLGGDEIQGTLEMVKGVAGIASAVRNDDGSLRYEYNGKTDIWWDGQKTAKTPSGEAIFVTEDGEQVPESQVKLVSSN